MLLAAMPNVPDRAATGVELLVEAPLRQGTGQT